MPHRTFVHDTINMHESKYSLAILTLLAACSNADVPTPIVPADSALIDALQGSWCVTDDDGKSCWAYDTFTSRETIEACGIFPETGKTFRIRATFKVSGTKMCHTVTESNAPESLPVGNKFCTQVLAVDDKIQRYKYLETGEVDTIYRVPKSNVKCPSDS